MCLWDLFQPSAGASSEEDSGAGSVSEEGSGVGSGPVLWAHGMRPDEMFRIDRSGP